MGDSDDEYERSKARDKFRRERSDYDRRRDDRRRDWEHDTRSARGYDARNYRGARDSRRDFYGRDYDNRSRERYSPRRDTSPPRSKRMRRDWDDMPPYDMPHYGGGMMPGRGPPPSWGPGPNMGPPHEGFPGGPGNMPDPEYPTQPPMMSFKMFLSQQDDTISDQDAVKKYNEYKEDFKKQQMNEFFLAHKDEEWFKSKYHPEEFEKRQNEIRQALRKRCSVYMELRRLGRLENVGLDPDYFDALVKILDAAVIMMEGGTEEDLAILDEPEQEDGNRSRTNSESVDKMQSPEKKKPDNPPDKPLEITITAEQKELMKKAQEFSKKQQEKAQNGETEEKKSKKKKRTRDKSDSYSYESGSESSSSSGSETESEGEPAPPGLENEPPPPGVDGGENKKEDDMEEGETKEDKNDDKEKDVDTKEEKEEEKKEQMKRKYLHKTSSIFLRNLAPSITKQEVEAVCKRYPGFIRVALQDPQPERRFFRRGWVTFDKNVNIKEICWNLNNIRLRDCDLGATLNRELKQRIRPVSGLTAHQKVVRQDIKLAARIIQNFDEKWRIWEEPESEKKDQEKETTPSFSLTAKNPVLKNITDYLVEEGSFEEEELLGTSAEEGETDKDPEIQIERDESLNEVSDRCPFGFVSIFAGNKSIHKTSDEFESHGWKLVSMATNNGVLDRMVIYLRLVHSVDYYSANEYPNEDEMPHRCGIMHARGVPPSTKVTKKDLDDWLKNFENKVKPFVEMKDKLDEAAAKKMGIKDPEAEVEKFVTANTQELAKDKWLCPLSGKKFKGPEFVRKHIFNKHAEKVEEVKQEVAFFNNYLMDPKRPQLPEHPGNKQTTASPAAHPPGPQYPSPGGSYGGHPPMGYSHPRPQMMRGGYGGHPPYQPPSYQRHESYERRDSSPPPRRTPISRPYRRSDPRGIIEYRDLDAPDDVDIF